MSEQGQENTAASPRFAGHARTVSGLTLISRVAGLARDAACARVFGTGVIWSAFVTAFMIPNLFRRLFGEGALTAAFVPKYTQLVRDEPEVAKQYASLVLGALMTALGLLAVLAEVGIVVWLMTAGQRATDGAQLVATLLAIMLPYMPMVCATAIMGGMLQTHSRFVPHAGAPVLLNICMITAVLSTGLVLSWPLERVALALAVSVTLAAVGQVSWALWELRTRTSWTMRVDSAKSHAADTLKKFIPAMLGMGAMQIGVLVDGLIAAWPVIVGKTLPGAGSSGGLPYPIDESGQAVLYYASRLYHFPLGVFGLAIATAVFPALSRAWNERAHDALPSIRHAGANPDSTPSAFGETLRKGIRLSVFIGLPASVGLVLVAMPLAATIFGGGAFGETSLERTAWALLAYAPAVWAYSLTHVFARAFYAAGNTTTPARIGVCTVFLNIALSLTLMWWMAERGLALATALAAVVHAGALAVSCRKELTGGTQLLAGEDWRALGKICVCSTVMAGTVVGVRALGSQLGLAPALVGAGAEQVSFWHNLLWMIALVTSGGVAYLALSAAWRSHELRWLAQRGT